jgi:GTP1/Obg family GTP-binding protein
MTLIRTPNIDDPDGFYQELVDAQRELDDARAAAMNARLMLVLANHVGDRAVLSEAIAVAALADARQDAP